MKKLYLACLLVSWLVSGCTTYETHQPTAQFYRYTRPAVSAGGQKRYDALAVYAARTNAPSLEITAVCTIPEPWLANEATLTVFVAGKHDTTFTLASPNTPQKFRLVLPDSGKREVLIVPGPPLRVYEAGPVLFTSITSVGVEPGYTLEPSPIRRAPQGIEVFGDSRTVGSASPEAGRQAWPAVLRTMRPGADVFVSGYGFLQMGTHLSTQAKRDSMTNEVVRRLQAYEQQALWLEGGVNDYLTATYSPAQLNTFYRLWLPQLHQALPKLRIYVQTDVLRDEKPNKAGHSVQDFRAAQTTSVEGFADFAQSVDGQQLIRPADFSKDGVHLSVDGDARMASRVNAVIR